MADPRCWTLEGARRLLDEVRTRTGRAVESVDPLLERREGASDAAVAERLDGEIQAEVSRWAREMEALGVEVKGPWLVDFDNGEGYYCWRWPEERLEWFHGYEEGFSARSRIQ